MLELASRNVRGLKILPSGRIDPLSLLNADFTYVSESALKNIEEILA
jgi:ribosomal protein L4